MVEVFHRIICAVRSRIRKSYDRNWEGIARDASARQTYAAYGPAISPDALVTNEVTYGRVRPATERRQHATLTNSPDSRRRRRRRLSARRADIVAVSITGLLALAQVMNRSFVLELIQTDDVFRVEVDVTWSRLPSLAVTCRHLPSLAVTCRRLPSERTTACCDSVDGGRRSTQTRLNE
ncbi:hypothetical protein EVAR_75229_1 [Eumeta japonica]|uniref:Uncharacterized protein n=1 Tax=Eumeta variegata TaxID=151549 RepID=A0A4C1V9Q8_EUMVA|nr:hypothetical protein EVAR_75229_1 [Eumeta japonica]